MTESYLQNCPSGRSYRLSCKTSEIESVETLLAAEGFISCSVPFSRYARILTREPKPLGQSIAAQFGLIYIQDKSSMLPPLYLNPALGGTVLDMCASPGGKTGILSQLVGENGLVISNEPKKSRLQTLRATVQRHNLMNVVTTCYPGEDFPEHNNRFETILLDVPCSGWGTADKHPRVLSLWTESNLGGLLALQKQLLLKAANLLVPGGLLLYSTCTTNTRENEDQIEWILDNSDLSTVDLAPVPGIFCQPVRDNKFPGSLLINGHRSNSQSFFLACLQKPKANYLREDSLGNDFWSLVDHKDSNIGFEEKPLPAKIMDKLPPGNIVRRDKHLFFWPEKAILDISPKTRWHGFQLGKIHKKDIRLFTRLRYLLPPPEDKDSFVVTEIALLHKLLSGQSLPASAQAKALALYWHDLPLGWLTVKGKRCLWSESAIPIGK